MAEVKTRFDYLLNAFERASQSDTPALNGYAEKRKALYYFVRSLEAVEIAAREVASWHLADEREGCLEDWRALTMALDDVTPNKPS